MYQGGATTTLFWRSLTLTSPEGLTSPQVQNQSSKPILPGPFQSAQPLQIARVAAQALRHVQSPAADALLPPDKGQNLSVT